MISNRNVRVLLACAAIVTASHAIVSHASAEQAGSCPGTHEPFDLEFRGGTVAEYVRAIREANPCANVLVMPNAADGSVPPIALRSVNVEMALRLISEGQPRRSDGFEEFLILTVFNLPDLEQEAFRLERVQRRIPLVGPGSAGGDSSPEVGVWGLSSIVTGGIDASRVIGAIEIALATAGDGAEVRYHEPTRLLVVRGTRVHISVVNKIIGTLGVEASEKAEQRRALEESVASLRVRVAEEEGVRSVAEARKLAAESLMLTTKAGELTPEQVARQRVELAQAEADLAVYAVKIERLTKALADAEKRLSAIGG